MAFMASLEGLGSFWGHVQIYFSRSGIDIYAMTFPWKINGWYKLKPLCKSKIISLDPFRSKFCTCSKFFTKKIQFLHLETWNRSFLGNHHCWFWWNCKSSLNNSIWYKLHPLRCKESLYLEVADYAIHLPLDQVQLFILKQMTWIQKFRKVVQWYWTLYELRHLKYIYLS